MFAVIRTGGKQYRVTAEDVLKIEKVVGDAGDMVEFGEVLAVDSEIGTPHVDGAMVTAEIVEQGRARKVVSFKKRRRKNSQRTKGHRQHLTTVKIAEILTGGKKPSKKAAPKSADKPAAKPADKPAAKPAAKKTPKKDDAPAALFAAPKGEPDDLTKIKGIGKVAAKQLNEQGITQFAQIAKLTDKQIATIDEAMPFSADQISGWRDQAKAMK